MAWCRLAQHGASSVPGGRGHCQHHRLLHILAALACLPAPCSGGKQGKAGLQARERDKKTEGSPLQALLKRICGKQVFPPSKIQGAPHRLAGSSSRGTRHWQRLGPQRGQLAAPPPAPAGQQLPGGWPRLSSSSGLRWHCCPSRPPGRGRPLPPCAAAVHPASCAPSAGHSCKVPRRIAGGGNS